MLITQGLLTTNLGHFSPKAARHQSPEARTRRARARTRTRTRAARTAAHPDFTRRDRICEVARALVRRGLPGAMTLAPADGTARRQLQGASSKRAPLRSEPPRNARHEHGSSWPGRDPLTRWSRMCRPLSRAFLLDAAPCAPTLRLCSISRRISSGQHRTDRRYIRREHRCRCPVRCTHPRRRWKNFAPSFRPWPTESWAAEGRATGKRAAGTSGVGRRAAPRCRLQSWRLECCVRARDRGGLRASAPR